MNDLEIQVRPAGGRPRRAARRGARRRRGARFVEERSTTAIDTSVGVFVVDLCERDFLDSSGDQRPAARAGAARPARPAARGRLPARAGPAAFELAGVSDLLALFGTRDAAAAALVPLRTRQHVALEHARRTPPGAGRSARRRARRSPRRRTRGSASTMLSTSGPHGTDSAIISSVTSSAACSKCAGVGSTWASSPGRPSFGHRRCTVSTHSASSGPQQTFVPAWQTLSPPPVGAEALRRARRRARRRRSRRRCARRASIAFGPKPETSTSAARRAACRCARSRPCSGAPSWLTWPPSHSSRMTSIASSSISSRTSADGHASPRMCSLSASPLPTPSAKRPSSSTADVAAACAMTAGWMRIVGQVTPVVTCMPGDGVASAPIIDHTNGLWPCSSFHGW